MLIGPGGVVALVLGGWAALWALRRAPGQPWSALAPTLGAFAAAIVGVALLTAHAESVNGVVRWLRAEDHERDLLRAGLTATPWRPLQAAAVALLGAVAATAWVRRQPAGGAARRPTHPLEGLLLVAAGLLAGASLVTLGLSGAVLAQSDHGPAAALSHLTRLQNLARFGTVFAAGDLGLAALLAIGRALRP